MLKIRFAFVTAVIFTVIGFCHGNVLTQDIDFELFDHANVSEILSALDNSIKTAPTQVETRGAILSTIAFGIKVYPYVRKVYKFINYALGAWKFYKGSKKYLNHLFNKADNVDSYRLIKLKEFHEALRKMQELETDINAMQMEVLSLEQSDAEKVSTLREKLIEIIGRFNSKQLSLQLYPTVSSRLLLDLAPIAARLISDSGDDNISCLLSATIKQYFYSYLYDRLKKVEVTVHPDDYVTENKYNFIKKISSVEFNPNRNWEAEKIKELRCTSYKSPEQYESDKQQLKNRKANNKQMLVKDNMEAGDKYLQGDQGECASDYMELVRITAEEKFSEAYNLVSGVCKNPLKPTGRGWIIGDLGAIHIKNLCDRVKVFGMGLKLPGMGNYEYCDPYVQVYVNGEQLWETSYKEDVIGWVPIEETFHSELLNQKDAKVLIRVMDRDIKQLGNKDDEMMSGSYDIMSSESGDTGILPSQKDDKLFFNVHWIDELQEESS